MVVSRQPIFIVNLKSNTMKNTIQIYTTFLLSPNNMKRKVHYLNKFNCFDRIMLRINTLFRKVRFKLIEMMLNRKSY